MISRWTLLKLFLVLSLLPLVLMSLGSTPGLNARNNGGITYQYPVLPENTYNYANIALPDHFLTNDFPGGLLEQNAVIDNDNTPANNPTTDAGATLGRLLFYDKRLSGNRTVACASCHKQEFGFTDDLAQSIGFEGGLTRRHSMGLANVRFAERGKMFWDERADSLEDQALQPIQDSVEMGLTLTELVHVVQYQPFYPPLFAKAFGDPEVTTTRIAQAIAQFERSLVSFTSKYDTGRALVKSPFDPFPNFTAQENFGKDLFMKPEVSETPVTCLTCHITEAFISPFHDPNLTTDATNIGLDMASMGDLGVMESTGNQADDFKFRVPSLRNIGVGGPYMHDGRFATLTQVVNFYSNSIQAHPNLDPRLRGKNGEPPLRFDFTIAEREALIAFLHTLTDHQLLTDVKFSDPFVSATPVEARKLLDGEIVGGTLGDLSNDDDLYLQLDPSPTSNPFKQVVDMIVISTSPHATPTRLKFLVESLISGSGDDSIDLEIRMLNHMTGEFESMGFWSVSEIEEFVEVDVNVAPERFVHPVTQEVVARGIWSSESFSKDPFFWDLDVDTLVWVTQGNLSARSGKVESAAEAAKSRKVQEGFSGKFESRVQKPLKR